MAVTVPNYYTLILDSEFDVKSPVSEETMRKLIQNINMLGNLSVIGSIALIDTSIIGVEPPLSFQFQICDGSEITNSSSPLASSSGVTRNTPTLSSHYIIVGTDNVSNNQVGTPPTNVDLSHRHTIGDLVLTENVYYNSVHVVSGSPGYGMLGPGHTHTLTFDLSATEPFYELFHFNLAPYIKIN